MTSSEPSFSLRALVRELALARQKLTMYQEGHPARSQVVERVMSILVGLVAPTGSLSLGVSRDAIVGLDERIESGTAGRLADALYQRSVAIVRFEEGVEAQEVEAFLTLLPRTRPRDGETPLWDRLEEVGVDHIRIEPIDFSDIVATDRLDADLDDDGNPRARPESLWEEILRRILDDGRLGALASELSAVESVGLQEIRALIDRVLERHGIDPASLTGADGEEAEGSATEVFSLLSELLGGAAETRIRGAGDSSSRSAAARHVAELLGAVPEALRDGILDAALQGAVTGEEAAPEVVEGLAGSVSAARVVASLRRLRQERLEFSPRITGLLDDLVLRAAPVLSEEDAVDPDALAEGLRSLFGEEDVDRIPPSQRRADRLALELRRLPPRRAAPEKLEPRLETLDERRQLLLLAQTLLDCLQRPIFSEEQLEWIADRMERVVQQLLAEGKVTNTVRIVRGLKALAEDPGQAPRIREAAGSCLRRLETADTISALIEALGTMTADSVEVVHQLIELLGEGVVRELLMALSEETDLARRRHTFDLLVSLGSGVSGFAADLVGDERWYVNRNMLSLLRKVGEPIPGKTLAWCLQHSDPRVRLEAVKCLGHAASPVAPEALARRLDDEDPKVAEMTATVIGTAGLQAGYGPLVELLKRADPLARRKRVRVKALEALGRLGNPEALDELGHFFRGWFATVTPEERKAAYRSLSGYPPEARQPLLKKGLKASDSAIREVCRRISGEAGA